MKPALQEKLIGLAVTVALALLAYALREDETVRTLLLSLTGAPTLATLYPRQRERELERQLRDSLKPPPLP